MNMFEYYFYPSPVPVCGGSSRMWIAHLTINRYRYNIQIPYNMADVFHQQYAPVSEVCGGSSRRSISWRRNSSVLRGWGSDSGAEVTLRCDCYHYHDMYYYYHYYYK